jgi:hypothetical protein
MSKCDTRQDPTVSLCGTAVRTVYTGLGCSEKWNTGLEPTTELLEVQLQLRVRRLQRHAALDEISSIRMAAGPAKTIGRRRR